MPTTTYLDLITQTAQELNVIARGAGIEDPSMSQFLLDRLVMMVDSWNLQPTLVPWYDQYIFNLKPNQQSYLVGSGAPDWDAPRPIRLDPNATNVLLSAAPIPVRMPLQVLSVQQWANISIQQLQSTFPQAVYLDRSVQTGPTTTNNLTVNGVGGPYDLILVNNNAVPGKVLSVNGTYLPAPSYYASRIWVWGVPTQLNQIELFYWHALTIGNLTDPVNAAPGYFRAMVLNLALEVATSFGITPAPLLLKNATEALAVIKELNAPDMTMLPDRGMPGSRTGYLTKAQFHSGVF